MRQILKSATSIIIINNNQTYQVDNCAEKLIDLLDQSYTTPSYVTANHPDITRAKEKGLWIEISFESRMSFKDLPFDRLLINLKPKYTFLNIFRCVDDKYTGKCFNFNLATNTTNLYKEIMNEIKE